MISSCEDDNAKSEAFTYKTLDVATTFTGEFLASDNGDHYFPITDGAAIRIVYYYAPSYLIVEDFNYEGMKKMRDAFPVISSDKKTIEFKKIVSGINYSITLFVGL